MNGDSEIAKRLIEHGAHVNWSNDSFRTPLHVCAQQGTVDVMRVLLDAGAKVDVQDSNGISPFHLAVGYRKTEAVRTLLLGGVNMHKRNFHGRWGLHEAQFWREFEFERTAEEAHAEGVIKNIMLKVRPRCFASGSRGFGVWILGCSHAIFGFLDAVMTFLFFDGRLSTRFWDFKV